MYSNAHFFPKFSKKVHKISTMSIFQGTDVCKSQKYFYDKKI